MSVFDKDTVAFSLKIASATLLGLYAGSSLYINAVEVPANLDHDDMEHALENWQKNFHHASHFAPKVHASAVVAALGHYALTRGSSKADLPFLISNLLGELSLPYTLLVLMPTNCALMDVDDCKKKGSTYIQEKLQKWNYGHAVRTVLSISTFGYAVYCLARGPN